MGWNLPSCLSQYVFLTTAKNIYSAPLTSLQRWKLVVHSGLNIGLESVRSGHLRNVCLLYFCPSRIQRAEWRLTSFCAPVETNPEIRTEPDNDYHVRMSDIPQYREGQRGRCNWELCFLHGICGWQRDVDDPYSVRPVETQHRRAFVRVRAPEQREEALQTKIEGSSCRNRVLVGDTYANGKKKTMLWRSTKVSRRYI